MNEISILGQTTSWLEIVAMLTGIAGVFLTIKQSIWCFPIGIINVSLYALLFISPGIRLYADALLQCIYILLLIYGWIKWSEKKNTITSIKPVKINLNLSLRLSLFTIAGTCLLALFLLKNTDASYPWLDSLLACTSLTAQWMIAKKFIENWLIWIVVDFIYLPLYFIKHLPLTAILYALFMILAIRGYIEWKKYIIKNAV